MYAIWSPNHKHIWIVVLKLAQMKSTWMSWYSFHNRINIDRFLIQCELRTVLLIDNWIKVYNMKSLPWAHAFKTEIINCFQTFKMRNHSLLCSYVFHRLVQLAIKSKKDLRKKLWIKSLTLKKNLFAIFIFENW